MRKRVRIAFSVLVVAVVGVVAWQVLWPREPEPVYRGKGLRMWLWECNGGNSVAATNAVRQIGTNAIPTLLNMLRKTDSATVYKLIGLWNRYIMGIRFLPDWVQFPTWYKNQAPVQNMNAVLGFTILGADAQQAVPDLIKIYEENISRESQVFASEALRAMGPAARTAIPFFLRETASTNEEVRLNAVRTLAKIHAEPSVVVPALAASLNDTNVFVRHYAAEGLGDFGTNARQAVPALLRLLSDPEQYVAASNALKKIDPDDAAKAGVR